MNIREIRDLITSAFSSTGLKHESYTVNCPSPMTATIEGSEDAISVKFTGNLPKLTVKKIVTLSIELEAIYMDGDGGKVKLKHFPDIRFNFDEEVSEIRCGSCHVVDISEEVNAKYGSDPQNKRIAHKVLHYCEAWASVALDSGVCFSSMDSHAERQMREDCVEFVQEQMKEELRGSIIAVIFIQFVLPYIIRWIAERIIDRLING